jgi:hypothetical protein
VYSQTSIPPKTIDLTVIISDFVLFDNFLSFSPPTHCATCYRMAEVPPNITHPITSLTFNGIIDELPPILTHLTTGNDFNKPVDKLPPTLTHLTTGNMFNQPVDKLPPTLTHLKVGSFQPTS